MQKYHKLTWTFFTHALVALLAVIGTALYDRIPRDSYSCVSDTRVVSQNPSGDKVQMKQELCGGVAFSDVVTLELQKRNESHAIAFFSYERNSSEPDIAWPSDGVVAIDIADVGHIYTKLEEADGMKIRYRIGHIVG